VWWVWSFFSLLHPSLFLQCFNPHLRSIQTCPTGIRGRWQVCYTVSVLALSRSVATALSVVVCCYWIYTTTRGSSGHKSHTFYSFCLLCGLKRDPFVICVVGLVFLFFVAPFSLLAVFYQASVFNQDVSTWNTGAVTTMESSKCTFLPLCASLPLWCIL
jgi:surface protein